MENPDSYFPLLENTDSLRSGPIKPLCDIEDYG